MRHAQPYQFRADHWPICPNCGNDELWSPLISYNLDVRPTIQEYIDAGLRCYYCQWSSDGDTQRVNGMISD